MNKKTKGIAALAAGAALMVGGAGTFALWFDVTPLGATPGTINTGDLYLGDASVEGLWRWAGVSHPNSNGLVGGGGVPPAQFLADDKLVPGDTIDWVWTQSQIDYLLSGNTIVANLYLDGVQAPITADDLYPLVLNVDFQGQALTLDEHGSVLIDSGLTPNSDGTVQTSDFVAPTFSVTFPRAEVRAPGSRGVGYAPGADGLGYGRRRENVEIINLSGVQIRLQQVPLPTAGDAGIVSGPQDADGNPIPAPAVLNSLPNVARVALWAFHTEDGFVTEGFTANQLAGMVRNFLAPWLEEASDADVAAWLAGGN